MWVAGIRPYHQITKNFAMQYELGYEYLDDKTTWERTVKEKAV